MAEQGSTISAQSRSMKKMIRQLPEILERHLTAYAVAAAAMGLLAMPQVAEANSIVVQNVNETLIGPGSLSFSLDNVITLTLAIAGPSAPICSSSCRELDVMRMYGADLLALPGAGNQGGYPLPRGYYIGPGASRLVPPSGTFLFSANWCTKDCSNYSHSGGWRGFGLFMGLRFDLHGQSHYGWAEINNQGRAGFPPLQTELVSFAYNRQPNTPILAGQTSNHSVPEPSTLMLLALGAAGLPLWRAQESESGEQR